MFCKFGACMRVVNYGGYCAEHRTESEREKAERRADDEKYKINGHRTPIFGDCASEVL